jgi:hypothetical protein
MRPDADIQGMIAARRAGGPEGRIANIAKQFGSSRDIVRRILENAGVGMKERDPDGLDEYERQAKINRVACFEHLADLFREHGRRSPLPAREQA